MRILPVEQIPEELWSANVLRLPNASVSNYRNELTALGLLADAEKGTDKKTIHGGCGVEETLEHFKYRFSVSAGRVGFTTLAPESDLAPISDALLSAFAEGYVTLLDIPCGCGSSAVAFLTTLVVLRAKHVLPVLPLTVTVVGGDCSGKALEVYDSMMRRLKPIVSGLGIDINWQLEVWDATRADSTAKLIDQWFAASSGAGEYVVCLANFSGALINAGEFDQFSPNLEQILGRLHNKKSTLIWVEPNSVTVETKLFPKIIDFFKKRIAWFISPTSDSDSMNASYQMEDPLSKHAFRTGVEVQRFVRR